MYDTRTSLLIVFLTHPGVLFAIPAKGMLSWVRAAWQASWVMIMQSFSEGTKSLAASMVYWMVFFVWAYIKAAVMMAKEDAV